MHEIFVGKGTANVHRCAIYRALQGSVFPWPGRDESRSHDKSGTYAHLCESRVWMMQGRHGLGAMNRGPTINRGPTHWPSLRSAFLGNSPAVSSLRKSHILAKSAHSENAFRRLQATPQNETVPAWIGYEADLSIKGICPQKCKSDQKRPFTPLVTGDKKSFCCPAISLTT